MRGPFTQAALAGRVRSLAKLRRNVLLARMKWAAWLERAEIDVEIDPTASIGRRIELKVGRGSRTVIRIGPRASIGDGVRFRLRGGELLIGPEVDVRAHVILNMGGGRFELEGPNNLGWGVVIHCAESIRLARHAHVAEYATIVDSSHYYTEPDAWSYHNTKTAPIELHEDVWVCPKATITSGVTIGDHTIVASNTVVVKDAPSGVLLSGVPARIVRALDLPWRPAAERIDVGR